VATATDVARLRRANDRIVRAVDRELRDLFAALPLNRPERARNALLEYLPVLTDRYGEAAAAVAAEWYDELRAAERVPGRFRATLAPLTAVEAVEGSVRYAAGHLFTDAPAAALGVLRGSLVRHVLDPGRGTVRLSTVRDPRTSGWQRIARADGCRFCVMLAQRGAVYKDTTVDFASHDDCNCAAAPSWDPDAPEVDVRAYQVSRRTAHMSPEQREAHNARAREWMDAYADELDSFRAAAGA